MVRFHLAPTAMGHQETAKSCRHLLASWLSKCLQVPISTHPQGALSVQNVRECWRSELG